ncbi:thiol reductant ABC exporter subunit CydC [Brochothrix campestris]|uniref:Thiol reductant ABC exporter subunit CydC n=1 Tax=Brochothrix campestris FSL F6-1037 TaxID=1265861 RepID=W7C9A0_9LIST|nr:thiol reductant ABC exporter subunit CydC [Brochothrix campestris]EUJ36034.1 hypothetical protein BCAMP_11060 [Brochothrix campestris FSL F6-1037]
MLQDSWIRPYMRKYRGLFIGVVAIGTLTFLLSGALMYVSGYLITKSATQPESILMVYVPTVAVRAFGIGRSVSRYLERLTSHNLILKILAEMRSRLYRVLEPQALFIRKRFKTGDMLGALSNDIEHLQDYYLKTFFPAVVSLIMYAIIILLIGAWSVPFALLLGCVLALLMFVGPLISLLYVGAKNEQLKAGRGQLYTTFADAILGMGDWLFSGQSQRFITQYEGSEQALLVIENKKNRFIAYRDFCSQLILAVGVVLIIWWSNAQVGAGVFSPTLVAAFALALLSLGEVFLPVAGAVSEKATYVESLKRLHQLEDNQLPSWEEEGVAVEQNLTLPREATLVVENVNFTYPNSTEQIIADLNLSFGPGTKTAIIGRSGTGKSTLLQLLQGALEPTSGLVSYGDTAVSQWGVNIAEVMGVLNQKAYLFDTTLANNLRMGNQQATDAELTAVVQQVGLTSLVERLPAGFKTQMREAGERFSGGERQRIALARILLQKTPVVVLDEPTVGLDPITEQQLLATMFETLQDKTVIWVTHHLIGVEQMDKVLFLEKGKVEMSGTHVELLASNVRYQRLYQLDRPQIASS